MDGGIEVAGEATPLDQLVRIAGPVELEVADPLILDERHHLLVEVLVVDRAGEGELAIAQLIAELGGMGDPLIPWLVVATPGESQIPSWAW